MAVQIIRFGIPISKARLPARRKLALGSNSDADRVDAHVTSATALETNACPNREIAFHNTALYYLDARGAYPAGNIGLCDVTSRRIWAVPHTNLRNVPMTGPFTHEGSIASLEEVLATTPGLG